MIVSVALAFLAGSAAPADAPAQPAPAAAPAAKPVKEKKICRTDEATTGSIMRSKTCHTKAEWDALAAREMTAGTIRHSSAPTVAGNSN